MRNTTERAENERSEIFGTQALDAASVGSCLSGSNASGRTRPISIELKGPRTAVAFRSRPSAAVVLPSPMFISALVGTGDRSADFLVAAGGARCARRTDKRVLRATLFAGIVDMVCCFVHGRSPICCRIWAFPKACRSPIWQLPCRTAARRSHLRSFRAHSNHDPPPFDGLCPITASTSMQGPQFFDGPIFLPHGRLPLALRAAEITQKWGAFHQIGESRQQSIADRQMPPNAQRAVIHSAKHQRSANGVVEKFASGPCASGQVKSAIAAQATCGRRVVTDVRKTA